MQDSAGVLSQVSVSPAEKNGSASPEGPKQSSQYIPKQKIREKERKGKDLRKIKHPLQISTLRASGRE